LPPKEAGETLAGMPGLPAPENGTGKGNPWMACALEAEDVGSGGENGSGG